MFHLLYKCEWRLLVTCRKKEIVNFLDLCKISNGSNVFARFSTFEQKNLPLLHKKQFYGPNYLEKNLPQRYYSIFRKCSMYLKNCVCHGMPNRSENSQQILTLLQCQYPRVSESGYQFFFLNNNLRYDLNTLTELLLNTFRGRNTF